MDAAGLAAGDYTAVASQSDNATNSDHSSANTFTVNDVIDPAPTLTAPSDGSATNDTTPTLAGSAGTDPGDSTQITVKLYAGPNTSGTLLQALTPTASGGAYSVDAASLADGTYTAQASQGDTGGNTGESTANTFTVDTTAPAPTLTAPADGSSINDTTPALTGTAGTATGDSNQITVKLYQGANTSGTLLQTLTTTASSGAFNVDATALAEGTYTAQASQSDAASNTDQSSANTFTVDTTAPAPTLTSPADGSSINDTTPTLAGSAGTDPGDSTQITVKLYAGPNTSGTLLQTLTPTASGGAYSVDAASLAEGTYTAQASQSDAASNTDQSSANTFTVDTTPPTLAMTSPADGSSINDTTPTLAGTAGTASGDSNQITVKLYQGANTSGTLLQTLTTTASSGAFNVDATALADGTYTARGSQSDSATNTGQSSTTTFRVDTTAPSPTLDAPADNSTIDDTSPTLAGTAGTAIGDASDVTVRVYQGSDTSGALLQTLTATVDATGAYSVDAAPLSEGAHTAEVSQSDKNANTGSSRATFTVVTGHQLEPSVCTVPPVKPGSSLGDAKRELSAAGCEAGKVSHIHSKRVHRGKLIRLKPKPGTVLPSGVSVAIVMSSGPPHKHRAGA